MNEQQVIQQVETTINTAIRLYGMGIVRVPVLFNLRGTTAGQFVWNKFTGGRLRFNKSCMAQDNFNLTVIHEVAHYVVRLRYGRQRGDSHGSAWQQVVVELGGVNERCHNYDVKPSRVVERKYYATCRCGKHWLTAIKYNRIARSAAKGETAYRCRKCQEGLKIAS